MGAKPIAPRDRPSALPKTITLAVIGRDSQETIALQPRPLDTETNRHRATCEIVTNVRREWADGDSGPGGRCTRCFTCTASGNVCNLMVNRYVSRAEAPDFSPRALGVGVSTF